MVPAYVDFGSWIALRKIRVSGTALKTQLTRNSPTCTYIGKLKPRKWGTPCIEDCRNFKFKSWMGSNAHKSQDADVRSSDMKRFLSMCTWPTNAMAHIHWVHISTKNAFQPFTEPHLNELFFFGQEHDKRKLLNFVNRHFVRLWLTKNISLK